MEKKKKKASEGEGLRQMEMMADRKNETGQLEPAAPAATARSFCAKAARLGNRVSNTAQVWRESSANLLFPLTPQAKTLPQRMENPAETSLPPIPHRFQHLKTRTSAVLLQF